MINTMSAPFTYNKKIIKKQMIGSKKTIAGLSIEIIDISFIEDPDKDTVTYGHYARAFNEDRGRYELSPRPFYTVVIRKNENMVPGSFNFTDSINAFMTKKTANLESILACILEDYLCFTYHESIDDWQGAQNIMNEFGYDDMIQARDIYRALHATYLKLKPFISEDQAQDLLDGALDEYR